ncbi:MAG: YceI family protein [Flavobacteriales bacterium]|nr:YceI family protein [Flavobacteriales bacterium]
MNILVGIALMFSPFISADDDLKVKAEGVKIDFLTDIQNTSGTIGGFEATIHFNPEKLSESRITGTVDVATLSTGNNKRDDHLKSDDYFSAEKHPKMSFSSLGFETKGDMFVMNGKLKIEDVEHDEMVSFSFKDNIFKGEMNIRLSNYDVGNFSKKKPEKTNVKINFLIPVA